MRAGGEQLWNLNFENLNSRFQACRTRKYCAFSFPRAVRATHLTGHRAKHKQACQNIQAQVTDRYTFQLNARLLTTHVGISPMTEHADVPRKLDLTESKCLRLLVHIVGKRFCLCAR